MTHHSRRTPIKDAFPVFAGLREIGLNDQDIGDILSLSMVDVAAWRHGRAQQPNSSLVFLTMVLADVIDQKAAEVSYGCASEISPEMAPRITRARDHLKQQGCYNDALHLDCVDEGTDLFRGWQARKLKEVNALAEELVVLPRFAAAE